jgi:hypothetical protein
MPCPSFQINRARLFGTDGLILGRENIMSKPLAIMKHHQQGVEASSRGPKKTSKNSKWIPIVTTLMGMIGTLGVSFIAVVPQLRHGDVEEIKALKQDLDQLKVKTVSAASITSSDKKVWLHGIVQTEAGGKPLGGVDVFLLPDGNNLTTQTDDSGSFSLQGIPAGTYSIIIRDSTQGKSGRVRLDESGTEIPVKMMGAIIKYNIR